MSVPATVAGFQSDGSRFVLRDPKLLERADYDLWNDQMFLHLDHRGRGRGAFMQPNPHAYAGEGRWFYIRDKQSGKLWSAPWGPVYADPDSFSFTVSLDSLEWRVRRDGIEVRVQVVLPQDDAVECWSIKVSNVCGSARSLEVIPAFPLGFPGRLDQQAGWESGHSGFIMRYFPYYVKIDDYDRLAAGKNITYVLADKTPSAWESRQEVFLGHGDFGRPQAVIESHWPNVRSRYQETIAAMRYDVDLAADSSFSLQLLMGPAADDAEIATIRQRYQRSDAVEQILVRRREFRAQFPAGVQVHTPDETFNHYVNVWLQDRVLRVGRTLRFNYAPQARNAIQDAMAATLMDPGTARRWFSRIWIFSTKMVSCPMVCAWIRVRM
ncbi:MAG: hypothetical protein LR015_15900 [Verrucomicrobia bacterium]|nr:hypothetical protein [Verrucomicrobiota bacterium]